MKRLVAVAVLLSLSPVPGPVTGDDGQIPAAGAGRDWTVYGGVAEATRYSRLRQIDRTNVRRLKVAWTFETGDAYPGSEMQCNPLVVDGVLYATTPKVNLVALDAATGALLWRFEPPEGKPVLGKRRNRGVTYWSQGDVKRIFFAVRHFLYSVDAATGRLDPGFGREGKIDLRENLRPGEMESVGLSTPGIIHKDLLIVGSTTSEALPTPPGDIRAFDVRTGALRWSFHTVPRPGETGHETWPADAWKYTGAANNWAGMALDRERGLVFVPTGSAAYDFYGANRPGDNLFANTLLALKAETGERVWHFQTVRHDIWDRDLPAQPTLVTVTREGRRVDAVAQTTKSGYVYVFERESGRPLFPIEHRKVPVSDVDGETTAETQPIPLAPEPFSRQFLTADMLTTRTPAAHAAALERFRAIRAGGQFVPGSREGTLIFPGYDGGAEWGGSAYDPESSLLYVNANEMAWILTLVKQPPAVPGKPVSGKQLYAKECASCHGADRRGAPPEFPSLRGIEARYSPGEIMTLLFQGTGRMPSYQRLGRAANRAIVDFITRGLDTTVAATGPSPMDMAYLSDGYKKFLDAEGYPAIAPPWGTLNAIDMNTGAYAWRIPFGEYPELVAQGMKGTGSENYGGPLVTAGGLVFIAATSYDRKLRAFDKGNGALLWETTLPAAGNATPATYEVEGRQFVVIAAGGGKSKDPPGGRYVAYALPAAEDE
jgi:quinoprotein glucose dehydrogenase